MNVLDLFSGIGGFSLGLERAGMRTVAFCECDPYCRAVLRQHWPDVPVFGDVRELTAKALADAIGNQLRQQSGRRDGEGGTGQIQPTEHGPQRIDVICGGFPCQDISVAGKGAGLDGARSGLWSEYARIIGEVRPGYVIVENVAALLGRGLSRVLGDLATLGFDAEWHCIPAAAVGAPHRRDRVWIIAHAVGNELRNQSWRRNGACRSGAAVAGNDGEKESLADADEPRLERRLGRELQQCTDERIAGARSSHEDVANADIRPLFGAAIAWPERHPWLTEPDVGRVAHGIPFELDLIREIENGNCNYQEAESAIEVVIWRLLRAMWEHKDAAAASSELYRRRLYDSVPELPQGDPYSFWHLGAWIEKDKELCSVWEEFYAASFNQAQDLQRRLLERIGTKKRPQALGSRVDRLRALGNAVVPQITEIIGRAICDDCVHCR